MTGLRPIVSLLLLVVCKSAEFNYEALLQCEADHMAVKSAIHHGNFSQIPRLITNCSFSHHFHIQPDLNSLREQIKAALPSKLFAKYQKSPSEFPSDHLGSQFGCDIVTSATIPSSVHQLAPGDIKVVAALGDSLTAANGGGGETLVDVSKEYRGIAFSIGNDKDLKDITTLPNILQVYNPTLIGSSNSIGPVWFTPVSQLNVAIPGSKAINLTSQAIELVKRLKLNKRVHFTDDWKLITIFIGANDLCAYCKDRELYSTESWIDNIRKSLDLLKALVPRALISIVNNVDVTKLRKLHIYPYCRLIRRFECPCILNDAEAEEVTQKALDYQNAVHELINSGVYDTDDQFTVVVQQFIEGVEVPMINVSDNESYPDVSFFAPDCFHFGEKAHAAAARALWTDMLLPVGNKQKFLDIANQSFVLPCPDEDCPYIRTSKNSHGCNAKKNKRNLVLLQSITADNQTDKSSISPALIGTIVIGSLLFIVAFVFLAKVVISKRSKLVVDEASPLLLSKTF